MERSQLRRRRVAESRRCLWQLGRLVLRRGLNLWRSYPLVGGVTALALAITAEHAARGNLAAASPIILYVGAILVWAFTAGTPQVARARPTDRARRDTKPLLIGVAIATAPGLAAILLLGRDEHSSAAAWPWLASLVALASAAVVAGRREAWSPLWRAEPLRGKHAPWIVVAAATIVGIATIARLVRLDEVPLGINADEGDRAAVSLQIVHGDPTPGIFEVGWYRISMVYFWTLAQFMRVLGTGYADARVLGALAGIVTVAVVTWIGIRHFGLRTGLIAGALLAVLGAALQFSRETTEAGPTAMLWAISMAFLLEGVRSGKAAAWIGSGMAAGMAVYFYPSGRAWPLFALLFFAYLGLRPFGISRVWLLSRVGLCVLSALLVMGPYLYYGSQHTDVLFLRGTETTVLKRDNAVRLDYYDPDWSTVRLLGEQVVRALGMLDHFPEQGGFWPTDRPVLSPALAVLVLLGAGWASLRWRDPRSVLLALWFAVGLSSVVFTVETPNLQRFATGVPALTLLAALVLEELRSQVWAATRFLTPWLRRGSRRLLDVGVVGLAVWVAWSELSFYFGDYARTERWIRPNAEGQAVAAQGPATLVVTLGRSFHMVNSGWVRLLAQRTPRGGLPAPGTDLPLALEPRTNIAFMLYADQLAYLPFLRHVYPGGVVKRYVKPTEGLMFVLYHVRRSRWAALQGARVLLPDSEVVHAPTLGEAPRGAGHGATRLRWSAGLRIPQSGNYSFSTGGRGTLRIDGVDVIRAGRPSRATVALPAGLHAVELAAASRNARFGWTGVPAVSGQPLPLRAVRPSELDRRVHGSLPRGLFGRVQIEGERDQLRLDGTLAHCCLYDRIDAFGRPSTVRWQGTLATPVEGTYGMSTFSQGPLTLRIGGRLVLRSVSDGDSFVRARIRLPRGRHSVDIVYRIRRSPGAIEWTWTLPGGQPSIVPPSALRPSGGGPTSPLDDSPAGPVYPSLVTLP